MRSFLLSPYSLMVGRLLLIIAGVLLALWFFANQVAPSELTTQRARDAFNFLRTVASRGTMLFALTGIAILLLRLWERERDA